MEGVILQILKLSDLSKDDIELLKIFAKEYPTSELVPRIYKLTKNGDIDEQAIRKIIYSKDLKLEDCDLLRNWVIKNPTSKLVPIINKSIKKMEDDHVMNIISKKGNVTKDDMTFLSEWSNKNPNNDLTKRVSTFMKNNNNKKNITIKNYDYEYEDYTNYDNGYEDPMIYESDDDSFSNYGNTGTNDYFSNNTNSYFNNNRNNNRNNNCTCPKCMLRTYGNNAFYQDFNSNISDPVYERACAESLKPEYEGKKEKIADSVVEEVLKGFKKVCGLSKDCSICLCECDEECVETECEHTFHSNCMKEWLGVKLSCPVCCAHL
jgi:hypothetical protein